MSDEDFAVHPSTGVRAIGIVNGRPVFPIRGGSGPGDGGSGDGGDGGGDGGTGGDGGDGGGDGGKSGDSGDGGSGGTSDVLATLLQEMGLTPAQAASRIRNAPKWEKNARENQRKAQQSQTLAEQLEQMRSDIAERDVKDAERAGKLAMSQVRAQLRAHEVDPDDVKAILSRVSATDLLKDGDPDEDAIQELTSSLLKVAGRAQPDPDQGKKGGEKQEDMNAFIRRMAGRGTRTIR
jgi:pyruvate/2-oxoglutarate dehydrogenase complex dihydrolipoamide acyltransferase (E2) component